jgi:hypothetical protein
VKARAASAGRQAARSTRSSPVSWRPRALSTARVTSSARSQVKHEAAHSPLHGRLEDHARGRVGDREASRKRLGDLAEAGRRPPNGLPGRGVDLPEHPRRLAGGHAADRPPRALKAIFRTAAHVIAPWRPW